jgi:hypothetical protein
LFTEPIAITVGGDAVSLPRTSIKGTESSYATEGFDFTIGHTNGRRKRSVIRLTATKVAANPFDTTLNQEVRFTTYLVADRPLQGYTVADCEEVVDALVGFLTASSGANVVKWLGGES